MSVYRKPAQPREFEVTRKSFAVHLTNKEWKALADLEMDSDSLFAAMNKLETEGAKNWDFNGHFGAYFFFTCDAEDEIKAVAAVTQFLNDPKNYA